MRLIITSTDEDEINEVKNIYEDLDCEILSLASPRQISC